MRNLLCLKRLLRFPAAKDIVCVASLLALLVYFGGGFMKNYLRSEIVGGWDGTNHYAMSRFYSERIFPQPFGWTHNWNAGMPWPLGYPPLFYYTLSFLACLIPADFLKVFQGSMVAGVFVLPCLVYFICRSLDYTRPMALCSGVLSVLFLALPARIVESGGGITLRATFGSGLYPHFFGALLLLAWLVAFLKAEESTRSYLLSMALLAMTILANNHAAQTALIIFSCIAIQRILQRRTLSACGSYAAHLMVSMLLAAFWILPLAASYRYFPTRTFPPVDLAAMLRFPPLAAAAALTISAGVLGFVRREWRIAGLSLSALVILAVAGFPVRKFLPGLPLQPFRLVPGSLLLMLIAVPYAVACLARIAGLPRWGERAALAAVIIPLLLVFPPIESTLSFSFITREEKELIEFAQHLGNGRSMVEVYAPGYPLHYNLAALLGAEGAHQTIWNVFRESGINAPFVVPLRNAFSSRHEDFGVVTMLAGPGGDPFYRQPLLTQLERAKLYYLNYFIIRHKRLARLFMMSGTASLRRAFGGWYVFEATDPAPRAEALRYEPAVVFASLESKERPYEGMDAYDWLRLCEEWFYRADFQTVLALAKEPCLDRSGDLELFKTAVVVKCSYRNLGKAADRIRKYVAGGGRMIFLLPPGGDTPLVRMVKEAGQRHDIVFLERSGDVRRDFAKLLAVLGSLRTPLKGEAGVEEISVARERVEIRTNAAAGERSWIYLKNSYFPLWRDENGGQVYMASPAMTLIASRAPTIDLVFERGFWFRLGLTLSLSTLCALGLSAIRSGIHEARAD